MTTSAFCEPGSIRVRTSGPRLSQKLLRGPWIRKWPRSSPPSGARDRATLERLIAADPALATSKDAAGSTPLHHAAGFGTLDSLTFLIDKGADVNAKNRRGSTPLFWALHDESKVRLLIARGAAVAIKQVEGRTPVYQAAVLGNGYAVLRLLLENGGDPNVATLNGLTPLNAAALRGDVDAMRLLIDKGAHVDAKNGAGATALMGAATQRQRQRRAAAARAAARMPARGRSSVRQRLATRRAQEAPKPSSCCSIAALT